MAILPVSADDPAANILHSDLAGAAQRGRGVNVNSVGQVQPVVGRDFRGDLDRKPLQVPLFTLTPIERDEIIKQNSYVFGIIAGRMNRISGIDWMVEPKIAHEDEYIEAMKMRYQVWRENHQGPGLKQMVLAGFMAKKLRQELPDLNDDMSNFHAAIRRWRKRYGAVVGKSAAEVEDWIQAANSEDDFEEFQKKWVYDLMGHGTSAIYWDISAQWDEQTFYMLPGGTVLPIRQEYAGPGSAWFQNVPGYEPRLYYQNEIIFDRYLPTSSRSYGSVPLDALVNKVTESLLFDRQSAERADGTRPPEKAVIFGGQSPFGGPGMSESNSFTVPLPAEQQGRIEQKFNTARQNAIAVISGFGTPQVLDLSRADTFAAQNERQTRLLKDIALVFNVSNNEINETGAEGTSGRSVSEALERVDKEKGIGPLIRIIDKTMTNMILPRRFGDLWVFRHNDGLSETQQVEQDTKKLTSGTYSVNEIREARGDDPFDGEEYDVPQGAAAPGQQLGSEINPLITRNM